MFVKRADVDLPTIIDFVRDADRGQDVESEILTLRTAHVRVAVDPTESEAAGKVGDESPIRPDKIVTAAEVHAEIMIFHAANDRLGHERETKLIVAARPIVGVVYTPATSAGGKFRRDLVAVAL